MKKILLSFAYVFALASFAIGKELPQYIITDCGTIHQIPSNSTMEQAAEWLEYWTAIDC